MSLWSRLFRRNEMDAELDEEIRSHLSMAQHDRMDRGESESDASINARREFGNVLLVKETTRDMWGWTTVENIARDLRHALRQLMKHLGFTAVAVGTLALGIGSTTAMFSVVKGVLLEPLQYRDPSRLFLAYARFPLLNWQKGPVNARHFHEWRTRCRACESVALVDGLAFAIAGRGATRPVPGLRVSSNLFRTLGVAPALGRDFLPEEELPGNSDVVLISDAFWQERFGRDPSAVGETLNVDGVPVRIIGVMPASLHFPKGAEWGTQIGGPPKPEIFRPLGMDVSLLRPMGAFDYFSVVRLKKDASPREAQAEMSALSGELARPLNIEVGALLSPMNEEVTGGVSQALLLLLGAVGAVLLIVCVNIGNLMLVRTSARYREAGIRLALGAARAALFRLVLCETLVLILLGGIAGVGLAELGVRAFVAAAPVDLPRLDEVRIDRGVIAFAAASAALAGLVCGLFPAWRLSRTPPLDSVKSASTQSTEGQSKLRLREWMVSAEVGISTVLLIVAGLLGLSFFRLLRVDKGFETEHIITQAFSLTSTTYQADDAQFRFLDRMLREIGEIPGIEHAGLTNQLPLRGETFIDGLEDFDQPANHPDRRPYSANYRFVSADYWRALGVPLRQGRYLEERDYDRNVAVVSDKVVALLWPGENPIGKHLRMVTLTRGPEGFAPKRLPGGDIEFHAMEVVGVVADTREGSLNREPPAVVYAPYRFQAVGWGSFVLRTQRDPAAAISRVRAAILREDPEIPLTPAETMEEIIDRSVAVRRFEMNLAVAFGAAALALASLGIYGVISFTVTRRTPELGIRIALGASTGKLMASVVRQGMTPVLLGMAAGLAAALMLGRLIASQLYGISANDPLTISTVAGLLLLVALGACWIPARRAARVDPVRTLRFE
jgi:putative ABC transport system permease protein